MKVYLALPCYGGMTHETHKSVVLCTRGTMFDLTEKVQDYSALCYNFNSMWCEMLTHNANCISHSDRYTHFAMLHSDIHVLELYWLDTLLSLMDKFNPCDVLSVVSPIKDQRGLTTTGIWDSKNERMLRRLTIAEVNELPDVFNLQDVLKLSDTMGMQEQNTYDDSWKLAVNTGLMLIKVGPWCEKIFFRTKDYMLKIKYDNNTTEYKPQFISEDWLFSHDVQKLGCTVYGTRAIALEHIGRFAYPNFGKWGTISYDDMQ